MTYLNKIDLTQSPRHIDLELDDGNPLPPFAPVSLSGSRRTEVEANVVLGIYKLDDDGLVYCWAASGNPRPTDFSAPKGSQQTLIRLERFTSTGEGEIEKALTAAGIRYRKDDDVGWITSVDVAETKNEDQIAKLIAPLRMLETLYLRAGNLTDDGMRDVGKIKSLSYLQVESPLVTAKGFASLQKLNLNSLFARCEGFNDESIDYLLGHKYLFALNLSETSISDAGVRKLVKLKSLHSIHLSRTAITDEAINELVRLTGLSGLSLDGTRVTDEGFMKLAELRFLNRLSLVDTHATKDALKQIRTIPGLRELVVSAGRFNDDDLGVTGLGSRLSVRQVPKPASD